MPALSSEIIAIPEWAHELAEASSMRDVLSPQGGRRYRIQDRLQPTALYLDRGVGLADSLRLSRYYLNLIENGAEEGFGEVFWMSDAPHEVWQQRYFDARMEGDVLIAGLGLGVIARRACLRPAVKRVTVLERDPDIIRMIGEPLQRRFGPKLEIIQADAMCWSAPKARVWDCAWFDIWPTVSPMNLLKFEAIDRRYGARCGWIDYWSLNEIAAGVLDDGLAAWCSKRDVLEITLAELNNPHAHTRARRFYDNWPDILAKQLPTKNKSENVTQSRHTQPG